MQFSSLFTGIGGFDVGLIQAGHTPLLMCDISVAARDVLGRQFADIPLHDDVRGIDGLPDATDIVTAGFPCQNLSQAGRAEGLSGTQSSLIHEVFRLARNSLPSWIVLENVPFMLQLSSGSAMRTIIDELETLGYLWSWRVVDTFGFGLPQRRERVYVVASRVADPADILLVDDQPLTRPSTDIGQIAHGFYWTEGRTGLGWAPNAIPTLKNGSTIGIPSPPAILLSTGQLIKPDIRDAERLQGFDENWTTFSDPMLRDSARWSLVGSAVSTPVAKWLGERLAHPGSYDVERDRAWFDEGRLPQAARYDGDSRHAVCISKDPIGELPPDLADFINYGGTPLSHRAASSFLARTKRAKLRFQPGFIDAVEAYVAGGVFGGPSM